jgi:sugar-specific transcriptional regulator TrmB
MTNEVAGKKLVGKQRVLDHIIKMINESNDEVDLITRYWGTKWGNPQIQEEISFCPFRDSVANSIKRGVPIRILGNIDDKTLSNIIEIKKSGANIRLIEPGFLRFIIRDNKELLMATSESYTETLHYYYAIISKDPDLVEFFKGYFDSLWKMSRELNELKPCPKRK